MATTPESPDFDFNLIAGSLYANEDVAHKVLWPLVDMFSPQPWCDRTLADSRMRNPLHIPWVANSGNSDIDVSLSADCEPRSKSDKTGEIFPLFHGALKLEWVVKEEIGRMAIIAIGREDDPEEFGEWQDDALIVRTGYRYSFDSDGSIVFNETQTIDTFHGQPIWDPDERFCTTEEDIERSYDSDDESMIEDDEADLRDRDIEFMRDAISALRPVQPAVIPIIKTIDSLKPLAQQ